LLHTPGGRGIFLKKTRQSAVQFNINTKEFSSIEIPLPPIELQDDFMTRLDNIHSIINQQDMGQTYTESTFQSLLHRAFSGKI